MLMPTSKLQFNPTMLLASDTVFAKTLEHKHFPHWQTYYTIMIEPTNGLITHYHQSL